MQRPPVYVISTQAHYDAAHFLRNHPGKCARMHGHRYVVEAALQSPELDAAGMAWDFGELKAILRELAGRLDHQNLNEIPPFDTVESSAENQARWFFEEIRSRLPEGLRDGLLYARVWEGPTQWAQYGSPLFVPPPSGPGA